MLTITGMIEIMKQDVARLQELASMYQAKEGWIVESEHHVNVDGNIEGLNWISFNVKGVGTSCNAKVFETREDAEKYRWDCHNGVDYYLVYNDGKPIYMRITEAGKFFKRELQISKNLLSSFEIYLRKGNE